ncbi:unnamed protein product [Closterium sp. Yama58-4]|nr:unnamed protein product [Closterium sp. Yama58-4]
MRGSDDRVEVFNLSENLWFAGTAQLPPFDDAGDGGASTDGDSSGNHGNRDDSTGGDFSGDVNAEMDNSGGDLSVGFTDDPRDSIESRKEELLARIRGGGIDEKTREALVEAANGGGARGSSTTAPAAAPASAPAPAVDPLEQQMVGARVTTGALPTHLGQYWDLTKVSCLPNVSQKPDPDDS